MIIDKIDQIQKYITLSNGFEIGIRFIKGINSKDLQNGRIDLEDGVFAMVSEYNTICKEEMKWEAHRKYIDLQYMLRGSEVMGYQYIGDMKDSSGYDEVKDIEFFDYHGAYCELVVEEGKFAIFFPEDAHAPCILHKDKTVKKIVVKIPV